MVSLDGSIYVLGSTDGGSTVGLYRIDGTTSTLAVPNVGPASDLEAVGSRLLVGNSDGPHGYELWASAGTVRLGSLSPNSMTELDGLAYIATDDSLYKSDGTRAGTTRLLATSNFATPLLNAAAGLLVASEVGNHGSELAISARDLYVNVAPTLDPIPAQSVE